MFIFSSQELNSEYRLLNNPSRVQGPLENTTYDKTGCIKPGGFVT